MTTARRLALALLVATAPAGLVSLAGGFACSGPSGGGGASDAGSASAERPKLQPRPMAAASVPKVRLEVPEGPVDVQVELALTEPTRRRGLMFRDSLAPGHGMLFVFPDVAVRSFWMKNTLIPLDMIFADGDGRVVGVVHEAEPETTTSRSVGVPARYCLEVPGGWARDKGVTQGVQLRFRHVPGAPSAERAKF